MFHLATIIARLLQSTEFFRYDIGSYFKWIWDSSVITKIVVLVTFVWGCIRMVISLFARLCSSIASAFETMNFQGIQVGGVDVLAFANSVLPLDEMIALLVTWFVIYSICAQIRFWRAAWAAVPLKAS